MAIQLFENLILGGPTIHELMLAVFDRFPSNCTAGTGTVSRIIRQVEFTIHDARQPEGKTSVARCSVAGAVAIGRNEWLLTGEIETGGPITGPNFYPYIAKFSIVTGKGTLTVNPNDKGAAVIYIKPSGSAMARFDLGIRKA